MGYLHIRLSQASQELLTIVMPFGFYSCTVLPMGVMPASDIIQSMIVSIFADMGPELPIPYTKENKKRLGHIYKVDDLILIVKKHMNWQRWVKFPCQLTARVPTGS